MQFNTVPQICSYVKPIIDDYRKFQSHKDDAVESLKIIFDPSVEAWKIVIDGGAFVTTFKKTLGKTRLKYLQELLFCINLDWYKEINFELN